MAPTTCGATRRRAAPKGETMPLTLRREDVAIGYSTLRAGGRRKLRQSRALDLTELTVTVAHNDTGLTLKAVVGAGAALRVKVKGSR
jgi:hypothetical protein